MYPPLTIFVPFAVPVARTCPILVTATLDFASLLPDSTSTAEPLCVGVEIFNITYGYYRFEQWNEVDTWDSSAYEYRFPRDEQDELFGNQYFDTQGNRTETSFRHRGRQRSATARTRDQTLRFTIRPDNLPGYVAIQLGLRDASGKGTIEVRALPCLRTSFGKPPG